MNTKTIIMVMGAIAALSLGGCVVTPHHGSIGYSSSYYDRSVYYGGVAAGGDGYYGNPGYYSYGYRPAIRGTIFFDGHNHIRPKHAYRGHGHAGREHHHGGHRYSRDHGGGHKGGYGHHHGGHRDHR